MEKTLSSWFFLRSGMSTFQLEPEQHPVDHVFATTTLSDKQKIAILGGNAAKLFGMKEA